MSKKINIAHSFSLCAQRILPIILRGVFEWNGELFACPFITLEDKKKPFVLSTWLNEFKKKKYCPVYQEKDLPMLLFFADPIDPRTFKKLSMRVMDRHCCIDEKSKVYLVGNHTVVIKNNQTMDTIRFVRSLSDSERLKIFPIDSYGNMLRCKIHQLSKPGAPLQTGTLDLETALEKWDRLQKEVTI